MLLMILAHPLRAQQQASGMGAPQINSLSGYVTDSTSRQPLSGASVQFSDLKTGSITGADGYFFIKNIPGGYHTLEVSFVGYASVTLQVYINGAQQLQFALQPSILESNEVIVTGVSAGVEIRRAPTPMAQVKRQELLRATASNLVDLLAHKPGISQFSTGPAISKPVIRGLGSNRVIVLNDGVRQEGQQWGDEHGLEIDEYSVQKVELLKGPASLVYGSDAMAGVIQVFTNVPVPQGTLKGSVTTQYQTNNRMRGSGFQLGAHHPGGFNWKVYGSAKAASDYRNRYDGWVYNSKFREANVGGYAGWNKSWGYSHLIFSSFNQKAGIIEGERDASGRFLKPLPDGNTVPAAHADFISTLPGIPWQHIRHHRLISDNSFSIGPGRLTANLAWQQNLRTEFGEAENPQTPGLYFDLNTLTYNLGYHVKSSSQWHTSVGVSGMAQGNRNRGAEVLIPEYQLFDIGAFVYTRKTIRKLSLSGGFRYDFRNIDAAAYEEGTTQRFAALQKRFSNSSASIGLSYSPDKSWVIKWNVARGFRAPTIAELASNGTHEGTNRYEYGVGNLRSETSVQADLGVEWKSDHLLISGSLFYNHIRDFIFYNKLVSVAGGDSLVPVDGELMMAFQFNQRNAALYGAEFTADLHPHPLDWLHIESSLSFVRGRFFSPLEGNFNIPFMPAARLLSNLRADLCPRLSWIRNAYFSLELDHTFAQNNAFTTYDTETATGAYTLLHAGAGTDISSRKKTILSVYFTVRNLGDVAYQNHLSRLKYTSVNEQTGRQGVFNMGRNFSLRINIPIETTLKGR